MFGTLGLVYIRVQDVVCEMHLAAIGVNGGWLYVHRVIVNRSYITNLYTLLAHPKVPLLPCNCQLYNVL